MRHKLSLHIPGMVSPRLLKNIHRIQEILASWFSDLSVITIKAKEEIPSRLPAVRGVACFFTGGVDSFYTLLKNCDEIDTIIFVHGFDISLRDTTLRCAVSESIKKIACSLGKNVIEVETNLRDFSDLYADWGKEYHGGALASIAQLLSAQFKKIYIAASYTDEHLFPWGSHPAVDYLWSTEAVQIEHYGVDANRVEKVAFIAQNDVAMNHLRVCWENRGGAYNCGECEKCLRTMINLRAAGALERCRTFNRPLDLSLVERIKIKNENTRVFVNENFMALDKAKTDPALTNALQQCLAAYQTGTYPQSTYAHRFLKRFPLCNFYYQKIKKIFLSL